MKFNKTGLGGIRVGKFNIHPVRILNPNVSFEESLNSEPTKFQVLKDINCRDSQLVFEGSKDQCVNFVKSVGE